MLVDDPIDWLRVVNITLSVVIMVRLFEARYKKWKNRYTSKEKTIWYALFGSALWFGESAAENMIQDNPGGPRVWGVFVTLILILIATFQKDAPRFTLEDLRD